MIIKYAKCVRSICVSSKIKRATTRHLEWLMKREYANNFADCYSFIVNIIDINHNNPDKWSYTYLTSSKDLFYTRIFHSLHVTINYHSFYTMNLTMPPTEQGKDSWTNDSDFQITLQYEHFDQNEFNNIKRDLNLSKVSSESFVKTP